jgi:LysR family transcriptional regulator, benzoate and cis,cis-muconate-responsive activator of ben and cat genes
VAEQRSFTRAAERISVAQPALSQQIRQLEQELGVSLFERDSRPLRLTEAGKLFLERAHHVLTAVNAAATDARRAGSGQLGRLAIGFVSSSMYEVLPPIVNAFRECYPTVELSFHEMIAAQISKALTDGTIDIGFSRPSLVKDSNFEQRTLVEEPYVVALPGHHRLATKRAVALADLTDEPFILHPRFPRPSVTDTVLEACAAAGFEPRGVQEASHMQTILGLVSAGVGLALVPESVQRYPWRQVRFVPLKPPAPTATLTVAWRKGALSAALCNFIDIVELVRARLNGVDERDSRVVNLPSVAK